jgi:group I intron endonuclease
MIGIYKITSPTDKIYIGQSTNIDKRKTDYIKLRIHQQPKIYNSINKHGWDNHAHEIIEECSLEQLNEREIYWKQYYIDLYGWDKMLFCELYDTGGGPLSDETKLKISQSNKGRKYSNESKIKMSKSLKGRIHTDETILKMKSPRSEEAKKNMKYPKSIEHINKIKEKIKKPILQYDINGYFIKEWKSSIDVFEQLNIIINSCINGRSKTAGGYIWRKINNPLSSDTNLEELLMKKDKGKLKTQPKTQGINISKSLKGRKINWITKSKKNSDKGSSL